MTRVDSSRLRVTYVTVSRVESSRMKFEVDFSSRDSTFRVAATLCVTVDLHVMVQYSESTAAPSDLRSLDYTGVKFGTLAFTVLARF